MELHIERANRSKRLLYVAGISALVFAFFTSMYLAYAYATDPIPTPPIVQASAAAVVAAPDPFKEVSLVAKAAVVIDMTTRKTIFELNPDVQLPLASLTKVPLILAVSEVLPQDSLVTILRDTSPSNSATILRADSVWHAGDLMAYTLVASSNDGATVLANYADESLRTVYPDAPQGSAAVWRMNDIAKRHGLKSVYFLNPSGLDMSPTQSGAYGSAHDIALLFSYASKISPQLFSATAKSHIVITATNGAQATASNTDEALDSLTGIVMGKTGFTDLAGGNLVVVFNANDHRYVAAVLGSTQQGRFSDMQQLVDTVKGTSTSTQQ